MRRVLLHNLRDLLIQIVMNTNKHSIENDSMECLFFNFNLLNVLTASLSFPLFSFLMTEKEYVRK